MESKLYLKGRKMNTGSIAGYGLMYIAVLASIVFLIVIILRWALGTSEMIKELKKQNEHLKIVADGISTIVGSKKKQ
jgi:tellurite resistance protein TehA-like permease